jgi:hypothetical protein
MTIPSTLLPHKHLRFCESLLGIAGHMRALLREPRTVDELWSLLDRDMPEWPARPTFTQVVLAIDVLFALREVSFVSEGRIRLTHQ